MIGVVMCVARASACDGNRRRPASVGLPLRFGASARAGVRIFGASRREAFTNRALTPLARACTCCLSRRTYRNPQNDSRPKGHVTELSQNRESSFFSNTRNTSDEIQQCPQDLPILLVTRQRKKHFTLRNHRKSRPPQPRSRHIIRQRNILTPHPPPRTALTPSCAFHNA
jgi:hypothetical protein